MLKCKKDKLQERLYLIAYKERVVLIIVLDYFSKFIIVPN